MEKYWGPLLNLLRISSELLLRKKRWCPVSSLPSTPWTRVIAQCPYSCINHSRPTISGPCSVEKSILWARYAAVNNSSCLLSDLVYQIHSNYWTSIANSLCLKKPRLSRQGIIRFCRKKFQSMIQFKNFLMGVDWIWSISSGDILKKTWF